MIFEPGLFDRRDGIPAADYRDRSVISCFCNGLCDRDRALVEGLFLEHPHRAVPYDRFRAVQGICKNGRGFNTDVEADVARIREINRNRLLRVERIGAVNYLMIGLPLLSRRGAPLRSVIKPPL